MRLIENTPEEEAAILRGISLDADTDELSDQAFKQLKPYAGPLPVGRPKVEFPKEKISIRLSAEVLDYFKSQGNGWQSRINEALKDHIGKTRKSSKSV